MKIKTLLIVIVILAGIYAAFTFLNVNQKESTMNTGAMQIDTTLISEISFNPELMNRAELKLSRKEGSWKVIQEEQSFTADPTSISRLLQDLSRLKIDRIVGKDASSWNKFELGENQVTKVKITFTEGEPLIFYLGGFDFDQQTQQAMTYLRIDGDNRSFLVYGYLLGHFNRDAASYRNRLMSSLNPEQISKITFTYPADSSFTLSKNNGIWFKNLQAADTLQIANFASSLANLQSPSIIGQSIDVSALFPAYRMEIELGQMDRIQLECLTGHPEYPMIIRSSMNDESLFNGSMNQLFENTFPSPSRFDLMLN